MGTIIGLGLAAAFYPQLLAVVVLILTRPQPRALLWACFLACLLTNVACGVAIVAVFRARGTIAGTSSQRLGPSAYLIIGAFAVIVGGLIASRRGRELLGSDRLRIRLRRGANADQERPPGRLRARAESALARGSIPVAFAVGAVLGVPGPFDLLAFGHIARGGYARVVAVGIIIAFCLVKFVLIEAPIVSYAIWPERTAARVGRFSGWMQANKLVLVATAVGLVGLVLIVRGISGLR